MASRACGDRNSAQITEQRECFPSRSRERDIEYPGHTFAGAETNAVAYRQKLVLDGITQSRDTAVVLVHTFACLVTGFAESGDQRNGQRSAPDTALLTSAVVQCRNVFDDILPYIYDADTLGRVELVSGDGHKVAVKLTDGGHDVTYALHGVTVEQRTDCMSGSCRLTHGLHYTCLVICVHKRDECDLTFPEQVSE